MSKYLPLFCLLLFSKYHSKAQCSGRYLNKIFDNVDVIRDIQFGQAPRSTGEMYDLKMDIYLPRGDNETRRPLFIFIHGGTFVGGDKSDFEGYGPAEDMAKRGYVGVSMNYRLEPDLLSLASAELMIKAVMRAAHDTKACLRYFYKDAAINGNTYGIDTNWVFIGGASAGSITALHTAYLDDTTELEQRYRNYLRGFDGGDIEGLSGNPGYGSRIQGVLNVSGALGSVNYMDNNADLAIYSLHNAIDFTVPYDKGYPMFIPSLPVVNGSKPISNKARTIGAPFQLETINEPGHVPFKDGGSPVQPIFDNMMRDASRLFYRQMGCNPDAVVTGVTVNRNSGWRIFPTITPAGSTIYLENNRYQTINPDQLSVTDITGRIVYSRSLAAPGHTIDTDGMPGGIYFIQVRNQAGQLQLSEKIVLQ